jgi:hypothetical protein
MKLEPKYGPPVGSRMISEAQVDAALSWLRDGAAELGKAKQRTISAGHMLKHIEAIEFVKLSHQTASARIRELVLMGRLVVTPDRRPTRSGTMARVYAIPQLVAEAAE